MSDITPPIFNIQQQRICLNENIKYRIRNGALAVLILLYSAYFGYCLYLNIDDNIGLIVWTILVLFLLVYENLLSEPIWRVIRMGESRFKGFQWRTLIYVLLTLAMVVTVAIDVAPDPSRLRSVAGFLLLILTAFTVSKDKSKIPWRLVWGSVLVQYVIALVVLRWSVGSRAVQWAGDQVATFLAFSDSGCQFVFGPSYADHMLAMKALPVVFYFGAVTNLAYYFGLMQYLIQKIGWLIQFFLGAGVIESFVAAANIFLGVETSALTVKTFLSNMTKSELHTILTCGFATIAGGSMAMFISFASHLLTASVMSAPAALAMSKVVYPELAKTKLAQMEEIKFPKSPDINAMQAVASGASGTIPMYAGALANVIAFTALLEFLNKTLQWFGDRAGADDLTLERLFSWCFRPVAWLMGVPWEEAGLVAEMIGTSVFITGVIANARLAMLARNRILGLQPCISMKSETISIYALNKFANFATMAIGITGVGGLIPHRLRDLAEVALRALLAAHLACFMTACMAGLLYTE